MALSIYSRYLGLGAVESDGVLSLGQRPPVPPGAYPDVLRHVVVGSETFDQLAKLYYGQEELWWVIADANPAVFPLDWKPGDSIIIPPLEAVRR